MRTHKEIFTEIYDKNIWGGSGGGSTPENTVQYRDLLQRFLKEFNIKSVIDWGCGDWGFSHLIDWTGIHYTGIDVVQSVIDANREKYRKLTGVQFYCCDGSTTCGMKADLLIVKDVLQHWSNEQINHFLSDATVWSDFKYILITNTASQKYDNEDIVPGDTRGLCARFEPLKKYNPMVLAEIQSTILSEVLLINKE